MMGRSRRDHCQPSRYHLGPVLDYLLFAAGLFFVLAGARWLVSGSSRLAATFRVPPVVIGLTVVGFGTSAPEMVISGLASYEHQPGIALGNVVGSNVANVGLVLGTAALLVPLRPNLTVLRREGPLMLGISAGVALAATSGAIEQWMGVILLAGLVIYVIGSFVIVRGEDEAITASIEAYERRRRLIGVPDPVTHLGTVAGGMAALILGAHFLVDSASAIAVDLGLPEFVVASTIIAVGTSVPELATSLVAALRKQADLALGNIIGSNVFNLLGVLGLAATIDAIPVSSARLLDLVVMVAFSLVAIYFSRTGGVLGRLEGSILVSAYAGFTAFLFLQ